MNAPRSQIIAPASQRGLTLVELMIARVLGLVVIGTAIAILISNKQAYLTNGAVSQIQDSSRIAFELLARDIRQAGITGCGNAGRIANVLKDGPNAGGTVDWYADFSNPIMGYNHTQSDPVLTAATITRVAGTDSIKLMRAGGEVFSLAAQNNTTSALPTITLNEASSNLQTGDLVLACDPDHAVIMQLSKYAAGSPPTLTYAANTGTPGNCSTVLSFPTQCTTNSNYYHFGVNSQISKLSATDWYVRKNLQGSTSLYRLTLTNQAGAAAATAQEMVRHVTDLQINYLQNGKTDFGDASTITNWTQVHAVQLTLKLESTNKRAGTDAKPLVRRFVSTVALYGRVN